MSKIVRTKKKSERAAVFAGLHLSGPNASKSSLVVLKHRSSDPALTIEKVYEKIGSYGTVFSDDRILEILNHSGPFAEVVVDCPLTLPPCVQCHRPFCPGVNGCEDMAVAYMMALHRRLPKSKKSRPVNPQSQRLWDVQYMLTYAQAVRPEPSYSSNRAPLVIRAGTLQKRLNGLEPKVVLKETSVPFVIEALDQLWKLGLPSSYHYRNFEQGLECRESIVKQFIKRGVVASDSIETLHQIVASVETFHGFISAWMAYQIFLEEVSLPPTGYLEEAGWVYLPKGFGLDNFNKTQVASECIEGSDT